MLVELQPGLVEYPDCPNIIDRLALGIQRRSHLPFAPADIMLLRCQRHRQVRLRNRELVVAPMSREHTGHSRVIYLHNERQLVFHWADDHLLTLLQDFPEPGRRGRSYDVDQHSDASKALQRKVDGRPHLLTTGAVAPLTRLLPARIAIGATGAL